MIEPIIGRSYIIQYITGSLYNKLHVKKNATFIRKSKNGKYIFVINIQDNESYMILYIEKKDILEITNENSIDINIIELFDLYIMKSNEFYILSINGFTYHYIIDITKLEEFIENYYAPHGNGYYEALNHWNIIKN